MTKKNIWQAAYEQLAVDLACDPGDFAKDGVLFRAAKDLPGRRPFARKAPILDMVSFGSGTVISAEEPLLSRLKTALGGLERDEIWSQPFLRSLGHYFLPDPERLAPFPLPEGIGLRWVYPPQIDRLYQLPGFDNALGYTSHILRPDVIALCAYDGEALVGMAGASADCAMLWQVGVDVKPGWRGRGLAAALVSRLSLRVLEEGKVPYYGASSGNLASQRTAIRAGFVPGWICSYGLASAALP